MPLCSGRLSPLASGVFWRPLRISWPIKKPLLRWFTAPSCKCVCACVQALVRKAPFSMFVLKVRVPVSVSFSISISIH